jgi:pseudouridylate synthase
VTPFMLDAILKRTGGKSLETNIALVKNNARLAAEVAVAKARPA